MSVIIKPIKNVKKISKLVIKEIKKFIKEKPRLRIGIDWNPVTQSVLDIVKKNKKIDWYNSKIFSLSEYKNRQTHSLESDLYKNFVENINIYRNNFESMPNRIAKLDEINKIPHLYNFEDGVDLMIFSIDSRGNFVFNDYESGLCLVNLANNGNDIYSPGIASILMAKKIICFVIEDGTEKVLKTLNDKKIEKNDALTYLQLHLDCTIFTLTKLLSKKDVNKNISPQNYSEFRKEIAEIQNELKVDNIDVNQDVDDQQENINELNNEVADGDIPENLDANNFNKNNLDKELEETLGSSEVQDQNLFSEDNENDKELEENQPNEAKDTQNELSDEESQKVLSDFEESLDESGHVTDYKISNDEQIYVVENLENENKEPTDSNDEDIISVDDLLNDEDEVIEPSSPIEVEESLDDDKLDLSTDYEDKEEDLEPLNPDDLDKELSNLDKDSIENVINVSNDEEIIEGSEEESEFDVESINNIILAPEIEYTDDDIPDNFKFKNDLTNNEINQKPVEKQTPKIFINNKCKSENEKILKILEIKTDTLSSIEWLLLENRLGKLRNKLFVDNLKLNNQIDEKKFISNLPSYIKLVYVPGSKPIPLLRLENIPDEFEYIRIHTEMVKNLELSIPRKKFTFSESHVWNVGAYFTYSKKTNEIDLLAFSDFYKFVYLLRYVNKPLYFYLKKEDYLILKEDLKSLSDEIKIVD